ncbi:MAG: OsmC family protein [Xanthobacteraceae bacterium]
MANIQSSPYPLAFPVKGGPGDARKVAPNRTEIRTYARALEGMQKEALVTSEPGGQTWRMVCDEGPYLNGTDLAPFPLAFFATGLVNAYLAEIVALADAQRVPIDRIEVIQDNFYTMEGSAVRGDMIGGALPVALHVRIDSSAPDSVVQNLVMNALARSPGDAYLRTVCASEFSIVNSGKPVPTGEVRGWANSPEPKLDDAMFDGARPDPKAEFPDDIIGKLGSAETVFHVEGGAGSSLKSEQKRTLHIRGIATMRDDGLSETQVQLYKPIGSNFRFLCDIANAAVGGIHAPSPLAYLSAGIAFCYLTQIGRYAMIMKYDDLDYSIAQHMAFGLAVGEGASGTPPSAEPVRTHVSLTTKLADDVVRKIVDMGERTCFLHAASRTPLKTKVRVTDVERTPVEGAGDGSGALATP